MTDQYTTITPALKAKKVGNILTLEFDVSEPNWKISSTGKREIVGSGGKVNCLGLELNAMLMRIPA